jgi:hypothetical protein
MTFLHNEAESPFLKFDRFGRAIPACPGQTLDELIFEPTTTDWMNLALSSGAYDFWKNPDEDIYTPGDDPK